MWKVLSSKGCPPATAGWRERLRCCRCFEGARWVSSSPYWIPLPKVVSTSPLSGQGRAMHSAEMWHDIHSMFLSDRVGGGGKLRFKLELGECFASYIHSTEWLTACLAWSTLYLSLWAVLVIWPVWSNATQACDAITHVEQHYLQWISIHTSLVGLSSTLHVLDHASILVLRLSKKQGEKRVTRIQLWCFRLYFNIIKTITLLNGALRSGVPDTNEKEQL